MPKETPLQTEQLDLWGELPTEPVVFFDWRGQEIPPTVRCYRIEGQWVQEQDMLSFTYQHYGPLMERGPGIMRDWKGEQVFCGELYWFIGSAVVRNRELERYYTEIGGELAVPH